MPILVLKDRETKSIQADVVPRKGEDEYAIRRLSQMIRSLGSKKVILKSDQEPAIKSLKERVKANVQDVDIIIEESPVGESKSNGEVERAIRSVKEQFSTFRDQVENRYMTSLQSDSQVIPWIVRHAAATIDRFQIGTDGKTGYQRRKGRKFQKEHVEIGECVWYLEAKSLGKADSRSRWKSGVWLGVKDESNEVIIGTANGIVKARTVRRKGTDADRWNTDELNAMKGLPWETIPGREGESIRSNVRIPDEPKPTGIKEQEEPKRQVRRLNIQKRDLDTHGFTEGVRRVPGSKRKASIRDAS